MGVILGVKLGINPSFFLTSATKVIVSSSIARYHSVYIPINKSW
jgi:hypothetical protein